MTETPAARAVLDERTAAGATRRTSPFAPPRWLRNLGRTSWLLVGFVLLLVGFIWLLGATSTIVAPVVAATVVAVAAMPLANALDKHLPRAAAAAIVLLGLAALAVLVLVMVLSGIVDQHDEIAARLGAGVDRLRAWLVDAGVSQSTADDAASTVEKAVPAAISTLLRGAIQGIAGLASVVLGLSFAALSLFFMLKDGRSMQRWIDGHVGVPVDTAHVITQRLASSLRGYFRGVTLVAAFNGVVMTLGALLLGVPLAGTIGVVTFVTAYVPYIGALVAGVFTVVIALGSGGAATALGILVIFLLANGLLQNLVQPFAMGSALELDPLVVLVATIAAGCLFGTIGLILAGPLVSAATHIPRDLREQRLEETGDPAAPSTAAALAPGG